MWIAFTIALGADCLDSIPIAKISEDVEIAEMSFGTADIDGFSSAHARLVSHIPCAKGPIPTHLAAGIHRVHGLHLFIKRDLESAVISFQRARQLAPSWSFPEVVAPDGHPVRGLYDGSNPPEEAGNMLPPPADAYLQFDGRQTNERPQSLPTIAQLITNDGRVEQTAWLTGVDAMFDYTVAKKKPPRTVNTDRKKKPLPWLIGAAGSAGTSALMWTLSGSAAKQYRDPATPYSKGQALWNQNHTFAIVGGGTAVLSAGFITGGFLTGAF